jgi:signal transduction histidine kinase
MNNLIFKNSRILIIDDKEANIDILLGLLEMQGYSHIQTTTDSRLALGLFKSFNPDLVLLDLMMPHLSGFDVLKQLRETIPADAYLPVLVLTADMTAEARKRALAGGAKDFLVKPFDLGEVSLRVNNLLFARFLHQQLYNQNQILEERVQERTSELEQANLELIVARDKALESDRLKISFLNNVSHEIRTPFNGILGFLSLLQDHDLSPKDRDDYIDIINQSAYRLMNTINDIVEISQIQAGQNRPDVCETNIDKLVEELALRYGPDAESKGIEFRLHKNLPDGLQYIYTDDIKLRTILSNLLANAIKFTETGSIDFQVRQNAHNLEFSIKDTGMGIPASKHSVIFERFMQADPSNTRKFDGSGLGLSIAKAHVELLEGNIWVESEEGQGATFFVLIPLYPSKLHLNKEVQVLNEPLMAEKKDVKILVAEDDEVNFDYVYLILTKANYPVLRARTGNEAVELCRDNSDIDLILMDIKLPGLDGYSATKAIHSFRPEIPIIALTAYALYGESEKAMEAGCNDYLAKPVKGEDLLAVMRKFI